jgi:hypothetical protein
LVSELLEDEEWIDGFIKENARRLRCGMPMT